MTLQNKIKDQIETAIVSHVYNNVWLAIPSSLIIHNLYFHVDDTIRLTVLDTTGRLLRHVYSNLKKYEFNK